MLHMEICVIFIGPGMVVFIKGGMLEVLYGIN